MVNSLANNTAPFYTNNTGQSNQSELSSLTGTIKEAQFAQATSIIRNNNLPNVVLVHSNQCHATPRAVLSPQDNKGTVKHLIQEAPPHGNTPETPQHQDRISRIAPITPDDEQLRMKYKKKRALEIRRRVRNKNKARYRTSGIEWDDEPICAIKCDEWFRDFKCTYCKSAKFEHPCARCNAAVRLSDCIIKTPHWGWIHGLCPGIGRYDPLARRKLFKKDTKH